MSLYTDRIQPSHSGISTYLENLMHKKYQIPTFQREVVWEKENVKKLWDSVYKFYPLGSILVWKTQTKLQSHREIGGIELPPDYEALEYQYILDGQQRTTSLLTSIHGGRIANREDFDPSLYVDLTIKSEGSTDDESYRKRFLFWDEIDDRGSELIVNRGRQQRFDQGLIVKLNEITSSYNAVEKRLHDSGYQEYDHPIRCELRRIKDVLDHYRISFIELKGIQVAEVCQIFERINQAGKPLNIFDIVVAKTFRPDDGVNGFYLRELVEDFQRSVSSSNYSDVDELTILQIVAVLINQEYPEANILNITDRYLNDLRAEHIEAIWPEALKAIKKAFDFLSNVLNIKGPSLVPYRYLYMTLSAYFYRNIQPDYSFLKRYFWYTCFHHEDLLSNTTHLRSHIRRLVKMKESGEFTFDRFAIDRNRLRETNYSSRGRLSRAILAFYASRKPQDWSTPHRDVVADVYFLLSDKPNLHHVFPTNFVQKHRKLSSIHADSLMNIAFLTQVTNLKISDRNPLDYLRDYDINGFADVLDRHLISPDLLDWARSRKLPDQALNSFVEQRINRILEELRGEMQGIAFEPFDSAKGEEGN